MVSMRAMFRRSTRMRPVFSAWPLARWKRRLNCSFLRPVSSVPSSSALLGRKLWALDEVLAVETFFDLLVLLIFAAAFFAMIFLLNAARDEFGIDRQLRRAQP